MRRKHPRFPINCLATNLLTQALIHLKSFPCFYFFSVYFSKHVALFPSSHQRFLLIIEIRIGKDVKNFCFEFANITKLPVKCTIIEYEVHQKAVFLSYIDIRTIDISLRSECSYLIGLDFYLYVIYSAAIILKSSFMSYPIEIDTST